MTTDGPHRSTPSDAVDGLIKANERSNETMLRLVEKVQADAVMRERKIELLERGHVQTRRLTVMVGVVLVILVTLGVFNAVNLHNAQKNAAVTATTAQNASGTYALLYGCFDPTSQCSKVNTATQRALLNEIKQYELTTIYCARTHPAVGDPKGTAFLACVNRLYPGGPILHGR